MDNQSNITENTMADPEFMVSISKQELATLPAAIFSGNITVVDSDDKARMAAEVLRRENIIGFDTETKPSFKRGHSNNVALLQLSTRSDCFLFRLNQIGLPQDIRVILESPEYLKIGVSIHDDFHHLSRTYNINPDGFVDLQSFVKDYKILDNSLSRIYAILFGHRICKGQRLTNWEAQTLTVHQQEYAALDALACIHIYDYLLAGNFQPEKSPFYRPVPVPEQRDTNRST